MKSKTFILGVVIGVLLTATYYSVTKPTTKKAGPRPRILLGADGKMDEFLKICPDLSVVGMGTEADYALSMQWEKDHWDLGLYDVRLFSYIFHDAGPDSNKLVRQACDAIRQDVGR